ncbi:EF-hand domain-containing protein [Streptomyces diastaticus]|uniref:EF-hand domain-containing protein n=1 Tax=Streptomyces diastaticus TaxID=1956 RepID=UPI003D1853AC
MDSAQYQRTIAARFTVFDQDGNGYISREDFSTAVAALLAEFGATARSDRGQDLYYGAEALWQGLAGIADRDGDQRITRSEFAHSAVKRLRDSPERFAEIARPFVRAAVAVADGGEDRAAGRTQTVRMLTALGVEPGAATAAVETLDGDEGRIGEDRLLKAVAAYFTTADPDVRDL